MLQIFFGNKRKIEIETDENSREWNNQKYNLLFPVGKNLFGSWWVEVHQKNHFE